MKYISLLLAFGILLCACSKRKDPLTSCGNSSGFAIDPPYVAAQRVNFNHPRFNPNNADEILFTRTDTGGTTMLVKVNLKNKFQQELMANGYRAKWNKQGWILFEFLGNPKWPQLWKIKDNGGNMTPISQSAAPMGFCWDQTGTRIFFSDAGNHSYILDDKGAILDTVQPYFYRAAWSPDNSKIALNHGDNIAYVNVDSFDLHVVPSIDSSNSIVDITWMNGTTVLWCSYEGIFKADILSGATSVIKASHKIDCGTVMYMAFDISPDGSKIITERLESVFKNNIAYYKSDLYMMNVDGSNEHLVQLK